MTEQIGSHAALMDATYRRQRLFYDVTRHYFLLGRDHLIRDMAPAPDSRVLEVACGTGRNLARVAERYPNTKLYGLDISTEMLVSARAKLGKSAKLARADACGFVAFDLFGVQNFDRIILSYSISMIPDWRAAIETAAQHLAPGGQLHIVDFGDQSALPAWFRTGLRAWIAKFHVQPRENLEQTLTGAAALVGGTSDVRQLMRSYAQYGVLKRR